MAVRRWTAVERRRLARELSRLAGADVGELLATWSAAGNPARSPAGESARRIGITGPPGAGKSTLVGRLAALRAPAGGRLGVLAIDPSSPLAGGALLGDRVRMDGVDGIDDVFVRSLGSRGAVDGLARNLPELLAAMDGAGCDEVLVETVGVGQVGGAVREQVDTVVLVLAPGAGDVVQALKAGLIELADVVVVNQSDRPEAEQLVADLRVALHGRSEFGPALPIVRTSIRDPASTARLSEAIDHHQARLAVDGLVDTRRRDRQAYRLRSLVERMLAEQCRTLPAAYLAAPMPEQVACLLRALLDRLPTEHGPEA